MNKQTTILAPSPHHRPLRASASSGSEVDIQIASEAELGHRGRGHSLVVSPCSAGSLRTLCGPHPAKISLVCVLVSLVILSVTRYTCRDQRWIFSCMKLLLALQWSSLLAGYLRVVDGGVGDASWQEALVSIGDADRHQGQAAAHPELWCEQKVWTFVEKEHCQLMTF